jgi:hypothetical protein
VSKASLVRETTNDSLRRGSSVASVVDYLTEHCRAPVVEKVCEYMAFKAHYEGAGAKEEVPINEFTERIPPEVALEL